MRTREGGSDMSYFICKACRMKKTTLTKLVTAFLVVALLMERFCFIVTVYKTKETEEGIRYGFAGLNCLGLVSLDLDDLVDG